MPEPNPGQDIKFRIAFMVNNKPDLRTIPVDTPLKSIIQDLIESHNLGGNPEDYALIYKESDKIKEFKIVTEKDRADMDANIIELGESPSASTTRILTEIKKVAPDTKDLAKALDDLRKMCVDPTFAAEFKLRKGLQLLMHGVSNGKFRLAELAQVLQAINSLQEVFSEDEVDGGEMGVEQVFVSQLAELTSKESTQLALATRCALNILATFVREGRGREMINNSVALPNLIGLLGNPDQGIQLASLRLINSLLAAASPDRKADMVKSLQERPARNLILDHPMKPMKKEKVSEAEYQLEMEYQQEVGYQLYLLQHHMLSLLLVRLSTAIQPQDGAALQKIKDLRSTAFDTGSPSVKNNTRYAQDHKKLGFNNVKDPSMDFVATPPGILALDCMDYFAKQHQEKFMKVVLENSCRQDNHECPFAASSCELVKLLAHILGVGQPPLPMGSTIRYHEMFFKVEHPFEEFYSVCVVLLNKTWREMRATREDFTKVFDVVKEQIESSLVPDKERPKTFDEFRSNVKSYGEISRRWQSDAKSRDAWNNSAPVAELKLHLAPGIEELITQQRGNFMVEGTRFHRYKKTGVTESKAQSQYRYVKLHPNHKTVYVGDWNTEKSLPTIEDLEPRLQIADIRDIIVGGECPFIKGAKKKDDQDKLAKLAFSLIGENTSLDLVAPDEQTHNYWVDGINTLLRRPMNSPDYVKEKNTLLNMEIKLRLLDLEGVDLPKTAPAIPPPPPDFNFASC